MDWHLEIILLNKVEDCKQIVIKALESAVRLVYLAVFLQALISFQSSNIPEGLMKTLFWCYVKC